jgi:hypothetical protein
MGHSWARKIAIETKPNMRITREEPKNNVYFIQEVAKRLGVKNATQLFKGFKTFESAKNYNSSTGFYNYNSRLCCDKETLIKVLKKSRKLEAKKWLEEER